MEWFYALEGQQQGPVTESQIDTLLQTGTIKQETLVWREGQTGWQPLHAARTTSAPPVIGGSSGARCVECQRPFPESDMVFLNHSWVCAQCKPIFLQRLKESGAPPTGAGLLWRLKKQMVLRLGTSLPDRCIRCNAPANGFRLKRQLYWHPPAYYVLIFVGILIYAVVAICVRKKAVIHIGLCEQHRARRKKFIAASWITALVGLASLAAGIAASNGWLGLIGGILLLGALILGASTGTVVTAGKIDKEFVWIKGVGEPFLANLPEWTGPR